MSQMLFVEQQIERHFMLFQYRQPTQHVRANDEILVGLVLYDMSHPHKGRVLQELLQLTLAMRDWSNRPSLRSRQ